MRVTGRAEVLTAPAPREAEREQAARRHGQQQQGQLHQFDRVRSAHRPTSLGDPDGSRNGGVAKRRVRQRGARAQRSTISCASEQTSVPFWATPRLCAITLMPPRNAGTCTAVELPP